MSEQSVNLTELARWGREERNLEYKRSINWNDAATKAKITKSVLAMANLRGGGHIVIGVERQEDDSYRVTGMKPEDVESFVQDHLSVYVNEFADPHVEATLLKHRTEELDLCIIRVEEFRELPVICKKDGPEKLRRGALYVRPFRKVETIEVPSHLEMRELLDIAMEKNVRAFSAQALRMGYKRVADPSPFDQQLKDLPNPKLLETIRQKAYWRILIRPSLFEKAKFQQLADCKSFVMRNAVKDAGTEYPIVRADQIEEGRDWISNGVDQSGIFPHIEYWTLFRSGQFVHNFVVPEEFLGTQIWPTHPQFFVPAPGKKYLNVNQTIATVTRVFEFAGRMAYNQILGPSANVGIELYGMDGRELSYMSPQRRLDQHYWCRTDGISIGREFSSEDLSAHARELALEVIAEIFDKFGWTTVPLNELREQQRNP